MNAGEEAFGEVFGEEKEWETENEADSDGADSDENPSFDPVEETRSFLSRVSLNPSSIQNVESDYELESAEEESRPSENGTACVERVENMIKDGEVEKLKVDECKVYLRKYSLRLSGNKSILVARIKEHLEISEGRGVEKYPASSFALNCKGDSCTGDVVMFEQKGAPSRIIAGRIVKESYGAAKQQHTFTIEVLWSRGGKPLPALYPLLIKGRNLYKLNTMRQAWADEEERRKVLDEKHRRGHAARCTRETRIREKETRTMMMAARRCPLSSKEPRNNDGRGVLLEKRENIPPAHEIPRMPLHQFRGYPPQYHHPMMVHYDHWRPLGIPNGPPPPPPSSSSSSSSSSSWMNPGRGYERPVCVYHLQRRCRYGETCRNKHLEGERGRLLCTSYR